MPLSESILVLMVLLTTGIVASGLFRNLPVPYTVILVVIGMVLANLSKIWPPLELLTHFHLTPDLVLFVFLPALIFESALSLNARQLIKDIAPVLVLAVPALLFSTFAVGLGVWMLLPVEFIVALLFGALISATDPVAVIALFKELGTPERLTILVEGESLLNDATAIVIVGILLGLMTTTGSGFEILGDATSQFIVVFFGGILVGMGFGFVISWLMAKFAQETSAVLILSLVLAYMSFAIAEHILHVSGVMAVVSCAIILGAFGIARLPHETVVAMHEAWEFIAHICNTLLFLFVGLLVDLGSLVGILGIIIAVVLFVHLSRASMIYSLVPLAVKAFKLPKVTLGERHIMFWGGLKGGLAIAIVLSLPADLPGRDLLINLTLGVVLSTLLINAPTIRPLIRKLGIDRLTNEERAELKRGISGAKESAANLLVRFSDAGMLTKTRLHSISEQTDAVLDNWMPDVVGDDEYRHYRLNALRAEMNELDQLLRAGAVRQYVYLDLRGVLQHVRDKVVAQHRQSHGKRKRNSNYFLIIEDAVVKRLREKDWASGLMSAYQNRRMASHMMRDVARVLMAEAALEYLRNDHSITEEHRLKIEAEYLDQLTFFRESILNVRENFPEFVDRFEIRLCSRAALVAAIREVEEYYHQGSITAKVYAWLEHRIQYAINDIPPINEPVPAIKSRELIELMPLFTGLPDKALSQIALAAMPVNYLSGDTIIGTGEHGDALYVVVRGHVAVLIKKDGVESKAAELSAGDFFGEMALLDDHVRRADVRAITACTLLRIPRTDVLDLAKKHAEISQRLNEAREARST